jgi:hypothetical protein
MSLPGANSLLIALPSMASMGRRTQSHALSSLDEIPRFFSGDTCRAMKRLFTVERRLMAGWWLRAAAFWMLFMPLACIFFHAARARENQPFHSRDYPMEGLTNHAMERTAGGFGSSPAMKFHAQPEATRHPASLRSSCSR